MVKKTNNDQIVGKDYFFSVFIKNNDSEIIIQNRCFAPPDHPLNMVQKDANAILISYQKITKDQFEKLAKKVNILPEEI